MFFLAAGAAVAFCALPLWFPLHDEYDGNEALIVNRPQSLDMIALWLHAEKTFNDVHCRVGTR